MKKTLLLALFAVITANGFAQVGIGTTTPEGALDINSADSGLVIPRVALSGTDDVSTVTNPQGGGMHVAGTLIYNTATAGSGATAVTSGFYYSDGSTWIAVTDTSIYNTNGTITADRTVTGDNHLIFDMNDRDFIINLNNTGGAASQFLVYDALNQSMVDMTEASQIFINRNNADIDFSVRSMIAGEGIALDGGTGDLTLGNSGANVITPGLTNGLLIADGSGVLSTTNLTSDVPNIYTADGTLTGTRTLTSTSSDKLIYNLTQGSDHIINLDAVGTIAPSNSSRFTITDPQGILFEVEDTDGIDDGSIAVEINPAGNDRDFKVQGDTDQNLLFADASVDAMGIGTNNLTATSGGSTPPKLTIEGNPATNTNVLDTHGDGTSYNHFFSHGGPSILRLNRSGGTRAAPTASLGQTHGRIDFGAHNGTDYINNLAGIRARGTGSFSGLDLSTSDVDLSFWTKNNRRLTISPDGNVGIGTTNITQRLTVRDDTAASVAKFKNNDASNDADVLTLEISNLGNAATSNSFINLDV